MQHLQIRFYRSITIFALFCVLCIPEPGRAFDGLFGPTPEQINAQADAYVRKVRADTEKEIRLEKLDAMTAPVRAAEAEYEARREAERRADQYRGDSQYYRAQYDKLTDALDAHKGMLNQYISDANLFRILALLFGALAAWAFGMWLFERRDRRRERATFEAVLIQVGIRPEHVLNAQYLDHKAAYPAVQGVRYDR